jgi:hypothetical protein
MSASKDNLDSQLPRADSGAAAGRASVFVKCGLVRIRGIRLRAERRKGSRGADRTGKANHMVRHEPNGRAMPESACRIIAAYQHEQFGIRRPPTATDIHGISLQRAVDRPPPRATTRIRPINELAELHRPSGSNEPTSHLALDSTDAAHGYVKPSSAR